MHSELLQLKKKGEALVSVLEAAVDKSKGSIVEGEVENKAQEESTTHIKFTPSKSEEQHRSLSPVKKKPQNLTDVWKRRPATAIERMTAEYARYRVRAAELGPPVSYVPVKRLHKPSKLAYWFE